jgi:uncharacterized cofD-like protein
MDTKKRKVVVVGGGTGTYTLLRGLKAYKDELAITAIVTMADSGGSTGRLRDQFGFLPVGDVRQALAALAPEDDAHHELLRQLFLYRYEKGDGLSGHNFGNLLLTALTDITGSEVEAIRAAARVLRVAGNVVPVTTAPADLVATYDTGVVVTGEHAIDEQVTCAGERIISLALTPAVAINPEAADALRDADCIVLGPGDLYTSIIANCVVDGFCEALQQSQATLVYVSNLMCKACQTTGLTASGHAAELQKYCGRALDRIVVNAGDFNADLVARYQAEGDAVVVDDFGDDSRVVRAQVVDDTAVAKVDGDALARSYIRHQSERLARAVYALCQ